MLTIKKLKPNQIITLNDFPVHNEHILKIYFRIFQKGCGKIVPPSPVMHKSKGVPLALGRSRKEKKYNKVLQNYLEKHPKAEYFLLDGSHKTTAATLAHYPIKVMVFNSEKDIAKAKKMVETGEFISLTVDDTIRKNLKTLGKHFAKEMFFQTIEDKTMRMIKEKIIPQYMVDYYKMKESS